MNNYILYFDLALPFLWEILTRLFANSFCIFCYFGKCLTLAFWPKFELKVARINKQKNLFLAMIKSAYLDNIPQ